MVAGTRKATTPRLNTAGATQRVAALIKTVQSEVQEVVAASILNGVRASRSV